MSDTPTDPVPERARVDLPTVKRFDALPVLYLIGFLILASALAYLWRHPALPRGVQQQTAQVDGLRQQLDEARQREEVLNRRIATLEQRPAAPPANLAPLEGRVAAMEARASAAPPDLAPLNARIAALEARKPVDLAPLQTQIEALSKQQAADKDALAQRLTALEGQVRQTAAGLSAITDRAGRLGRLQAAAAALAAGQPLGDIPGAPPALARYAQAAPPTEAGLRLGFDSAAAAAHRASQPALTDGQPFLDRMWTRAQQAVTIRQGERVIVGDPIAGILQRAREQLDAGDLAGAVKTLTGGLAGPARAEMDGWIAQAQALLEARAAIASAANG